MSTEPTHHRSRRAETHTVHNQATPLVDYNLFTSDVALVEALARHGAGRSTETLETLGARLGSEEFQTHGYLANLHPPTLRTHDHYGNRVDEISYHPSYHTLMATDKEFGIHSDPWLKPGPGAHVVRAAKGFLGAQVDPGHGCPTTMTHALPATLRLEPSLAERWLPGILNGHYDPRNRPAHEKSGLTAGMAITEKQGGSDVRALDTRATPVGAGGSGAEYRLVGHKYFVSGGMADCFLTLAQTEGGLGCFLIPRWLPDGTKNAWHLTQLKEKMGNLSNASAESELRGATAWLIGEEGRGVHAILNAIMLTRFDCIMGSAAGMRLATAQAIHHCRQRSAFGKKLADQPLMANVLADLAVESEAAMALTMRMAAAIDSASAGDVEAKAFLRLATALAKYWVCKRAPQHAYEALECVGGSGVMRTSPLSRAYTEAPINSIWEGSGNMQALDVLRAMARNPESVEVVVAEIRRARGADAAFDAFTDETLSEVARMRGAADDALQFQARRIAERLALALQASVLLQGGNDDVAAAFVGSRLGTARHYAMYGTLRDTARAARIVARAAPSTD